MQSTYSLVETNAVSDKPFSKWLSNLGWVYFKSISCLPKYPSLILISVLKSALISAYILTMSLI